MKAGLVVAHGPQTTRMARSKTQSKPASRPQTAAPQRAPARSRSAPPTVSPRWLLTALAISIPGAALCVWAALCFLFWQGSWQLLYHPTAAITRTPASVGLTSDAVGFAASETGVPQLHGWWIAANAPAKYTVLYLHDRSGNLSDTVDDLARWRATGVNVFAFDYRGYGQSVFVHPSEARWRKDSSQALAYLTGTRHIDPHRIVIAGKGLGADLGLEVAAEHPELAGLVLESPLNAPAEIIFKDARAELVPARMLVRDRWDVTAAAETLHIPSLWFVENSGSDVGQMFDRVSAAKTRVWLAAGPSAEKQFEQAFSNWKDGLQSR